MHEDALGRHPFALIGRYVHRVHTKVRPAGRQDGLTGPALDL
jgi:hypothetical protein